MKKIDTIDKINQFLIDRDEVIWSGNTVFLNSKVISEGDVKLIRLYERRVYIQKSNSSELIDTITFEKNTLPNVGELIQSEILLYGKYNDSYTQRIVYAINYRTQKELWRKEEGLGKIHWNNDQLLGGYNSYLNRYNPQTGDKMWEINLKKFGKYFINDEFNDMDLQEFIGIHKNIIYIKAGTSLILGINVNTGNIEFELKYEQDFLVLDNLRLDKERNSIFSIGPNHYIEFDLQSANYKLVDISNQTSENGVNTTRLAGWNSDRIYFWEGSSNNRFGEFSRDSKEINWSKSIEEVEGKFPAIKGLKYGFGKLYINDHNDRLHIYQIKDYAE